MHAERRQQKTLHCWQFCLVSRADSFVESNKSVSFKKNMTVQRALHFTPITSQRAEINFKRKQDRRRQISRLSRSVRIRKEINKIYSTARDTHGAFCFIRLCGSQQNIHTQQNRPVGHKRVTHRNRLPETAVKTFSHHTSRNPMMAPNRTFASARNIGPLAIHPSIHPSLHTDTHTYMQTKIYI